MANITSYLNAILSAVYGEEVRGSIHDAIAAMNTESSNAMQYASTAKDSAQASAASAQSSASTATQKANAASASAQSAKTSETNAKTSETGAANSASAAAASATAAKASETAAANSETAAGIAKTNAEAAAEAAGWSEDAADKSAKDAAASALSAQQYSGKPPKPQNGTWWIWDAGQQQYIDSGIGCELVGPAGNGVQGIRLTSGDHTPGTTDIYTVSMTDGTTISISVYNGRNGTGAGDVLGIAFDLVLPASGWADGELTVADSRLLALATHKYLIDADEASRKEYLDCKVQAKDITTTGFITFKNETDPAEDLTVNVVRLELSANGA